MVLPLSTHIPGLEGKGTKWISVSPQFTALGEEGLLTGQQRGGFNPRLISYIINSAVPARVRKKLQVCAGHSERSR